MMVFSTSTKTTPSTSIWRRRAFRYVKALCVLIFWLLIWQYVAYKVHNPLLIPFPREVGARLWELLWSLSFWKIIGRSLFRIMTGFTLGVIGGLIMALLTSFFSPLDDLFSPALKSILATPVASFIILLIIWFDPSLAPALVAMLVVLPMVWRHMHGGIIAFDSQLVEMARLFRLSPLRRLRRLYIPGLIPPFLSACSVGVGLAWKSGVAAEVISYSRYSIGGELKAGQTYLETADVFVWTIVVIILSLLIERLLTDLFRQLNRSYNKKVS
ncbi:MAG: ABC transporter permease subunit [Firmicutes bacterium]|nr:ABC transporter permease subunit [Bacillota bacterium]